MHQESKHRTIERYGQLFPGQLLSTNGRQHWPGFWVEQCQTSDFETPTVAYTNHLIAIQLSGTTTVSYTPSYSVETHTASRGHLGVMPQGIPLQGLVVGDATWIAIYLDPKFTAQTVHEAANCDRIQLLPQILLSDPLIWGIGHCLAQGINPTTYYGQLYAESLASTLAVHLIQNYAGSPPYIRNYSGGLSNRQLKQVLGYIQAHLDQEIQLTDLAALVGMSRYYFSRLFRQSIGVSPYQYVLQQRVERAKSLLKGKRRMAIAEIALACGFSHQSHMNHHFKRVVGVTPKEYLRSLL